MLNESVSCAETKLFPCSIREMRPPIAYASNVNPRLIVAWTRRQKSCCRMKNPCADFKVWREEKTTLCVANGAHWQNVQSASISACVSIADNVASNLLWTFHDYPVINLHLDIPIVEILVSHLRYAPAALAAECSDSSVQIGMASATHSKHTASLRASKECANSRFFLIFPIYQRH